MSDVTPKQKEVFASMLLDKGIEAEDPSKIKYKNRPTHPE